MITDKLKELVATYIQGTAILIVEKLVKVVIH